MNRIDALKGLWNPRNLNKQIGLPKMSLRWETFEGPYGTGRKLSETVKPCYSYVLAMIDALYDCWSFVGGYNIKATNGTSYSFNITTAAAWKAQAGVGDNTYGIQVGTGTQAPSISQYTLATLIANGTNPTQLQYGATSVGVPATVGGTRQFTIARTFTNVSGDSIAITEIGLVTADGNANHDWLTEYSLTTETIANLASGTATYTIGTTV